MNRKFLEDQGLEKEVIDAIMTEHGKTVNPLNQQVATLTTERDGLKTDLADRDSQIEKLGNSTDDVETLKGEIQTLKTANATKDTERKKLLDDQKLEYEVLLAVRDAKAKNPKAVKSLLDMDTVKLDENGKVTGLKEQLDNVIESDGYMFDIQETNPGDEGGNGGGTQTPPAGSNDYVPGSNKQGNGGKEPKAGDLGRQMASEIYGTQKEED